MYLFLSSDRVSECEIAGSERSDANNVYKYVIIMSVCFHRINIKQ